MRPVEETRYFLKGCHRDLTHDVHSPDLSLDSSSVDTSVQWALTLVSHLVDGTAFRTFVAAALNLPKGKPTTAPLDLRIIHSGDDIEVRERPLKTKTESQELKPFFERLFNEHAPYVKDPGDGWVRLNAVNAENLTFAERVRKMELTRRIDYCLRHLFFNQYAKDRSFQYYQVKGGNGWHTGKQHVTVKEAQARLAKKVEALKAGKDDSPKGTYHLRHGDDLAAWYDWDAQNNALKLRPYPEEELIEYPAR